MISKPGVCFQPPPLFNLFLIFLGSCLAINIDADSVIANVKGFIYPILRHLVLGDTVNGNVVLYAASVAPLKMGCLRDQLYMQRFHCDIQIKEMNFKRLDQPFQISSELNLEVSFVLM